MQIYSPLLASFGLALAWRLYLGSEIGRLGDRDRDAYRERNDYGGTVDIGVIQAVFVVERKWAGVGVGVGVGVASPKTKSNKQPRVDSSDMDGGLETGNAGKEVRKVGVGRARVWRMLPPTSGTKLTVKAKDQKADVEKEARIIVVGE